MKKLFTYIAMFAAAVSCQDMYGPEQTPIKPVASEGIEVSVLNVGDNDVTFVLAPKGEATYYSYLVDMSETAEALDSAAVLACSYEGVAAGTIKWTAAAPKDTVTVSRLASNATYQIYAVAGSSMGIPSAVVNTSFKTSDKVAPVLAEAYETADSVVVISFNEPVVRGTGKIVAGVYAMNSAEIAKGQPIGTIPVEESWVAVSGNSVQISVSGLPAGAFYSINYEEGAFTDVCKNKVAALSSAVVYSEDTGYEAAYVGVGGRNAVIEWSFEDLPAGISDWTAPITLVPDTPYGIGYCYGEDFMIGYVQSASKATAYTVAYKSGYGFDQTGNLVLFLPEEPTKGCGIMVGIPAENFEDYFGNFNAEWEGMTTSLYDMEVPFENVVGNYALTEANALTGKFSTAPMTIVASDDPVQGNIMMTTYAGFECNVSPIYGVYDPAAGTLTFSARQVFASIMLSETESGYLMFTSNTVSSQGQVGIGTDSVVWTLVEPNHIKGANFYYGMVVLNAKGQATSIYSANAPQYTEATLIPQAETPASTSVKVVTGFPIGSTLTF